MAGKVAVNQVQLGDSATASQNFVLQTNVDGTMKLSRGNVGAIISDIFTVDASGIVTMTQGSLGVNQTWQDKTASRTLGSTYPNDTGKPIQILVSVNNFGVNNYTNLMIGGVLMAQFGGTSATGTANRTDLVSAIIPAGATYSLVAGSGAPAIAKWSELR